MHINLLVLFFIFFSNFSSGSTIFDLSIPFFRSEMLQWSAVRSQITVCNYFTKLCVYFFFLRHGGATALLYLFWIVATMVMAATQTLILVRRNEIIDHFDKHSSFWKNSATKNCTKTKRVKFHVLLVSFWG